jgi:DNA-binding response OmpR family regulator
MSQPPHILVVDDFRAVSIILERLFTSRGFVVTLAHQLEPAREQLRRTHFDLIFLDLMLPDGNGMDFLREVRRTHPEIPVIVISGMGQLVMREEVKREGAVAYLVKPFELAEVLQLVEQVLNIDVAGEG